MINNYFILVFSLLLKCLQLPMAVGGHHLFQMEKSKQVLNTITNIKKGLSISVSNTTPWRGDRSKPVSMVNGLEILDATVS